MAKKQKHPLKAFAEKWQPEDTKRAKEFLDELEALVGHVVDDAVTQTADAMRKALAEEHPGLPVLSLVPGKKP
jgi:hypothetical protein